MPYWIVQGEGIYSYNMLPDILRVRNSSYKEAEKWREFVAKMMSQSTLCFQIHEIEKE